MRRKSHFVIGIVDFVLENTNYSQLPHLPLAHVEERGSALALFGKGGGVLPGGGRGRHLTALLSWTSSWRTSGLDYLTDQIAVGLARAGVPVP